MSELRGWKDYDLEQTGRLTHPLRYDRATDRYVACDWDEAFAGIGAELQAIDPGAAVFYASGRASLETSYLYALFARLYGHNNLPDSSNMCHETTSVALKEVIGSPVGTCVLADFELCDAIFFFGQNPGTNSPRLLHPLQEAVKRGCKIVTFNPIKEKGLEEFKNPQSPKEMLTPEATQISTLYLQVKTGGDIAAITGMMKHVFAREEREVGEREAPCPRRRFHRAAHHRLRRAQGRMSTRPTGRRSRTKAASPAPTSRRRPTSTSTPSARSRCTAWA